MKECGYIQRFPFYIGKCPISTRKNGDTKAFGGLTRRLSRRLLDKSLDDPPTPRPNFISSLYPYLRASLFRLSTHKSRFLAGPVPRDNSALASSLTASRLCFIINGEFGPNRNHSFLDRL